ncbi:MAG: patatin-like phospholipase family protein [Bacteroidota bacterium]
MPEYTYDEHTYENDTFYLGLTMAGAVSAGAYTGGVLDYIFEVFDKWEKAKTGELQIPEYSKEDIPQHRVVIDVMGGTSAGGMTTVMSALYAIQNNINPVTDKEADKPGGKKNNIFYDSWVNLIDEQDNSTLLQALQTDDIQKDNKVHSALNSEFIDKIAKQAFSIPGKSDTNPAANLPAYVSSDLEMLISHTMVTGIPLTVDFGHKGSSLTNPPSHSTYEHFLFSHFRLNSGKEVNPEQYFWLNPFDEKSRKHLIKSAIATGAFPVGLKYRTFDYDDFNAEYLKNSLSRVISKQMGAESPGIKENIQWDEQLLKNYKSVSVDGGAINNEPFGEVMSLLEHRRQEPTYDVDGKAYQKYGMVMIDPFPDFHVMRDRIELPKDLLGVIPQIIGTLWDQAKVKRNELKEQFDNKVLQGVIYPVKYKSNGERKYKNPLACGALGAFSGFLDLDFRHHDFFLGRNNARNYLRAFLSVPYEPESGNVHPLHRDKFWKNDEVRKKFIIKLKDGNYLPLIPDMNLLLEKKDPGKDRYHYSVPDIPQISKQKLATLTKDIYLRTSAIASAYLGLPYETEVSKPSRFGNFIGRVFNNKIKKTVRGIAASKAQETAYNTMLKDLEKAGLLEGSKQESEAR